MTSIIFANNKQRGQIQSHFNCSSALISLALSFKRNSILARQIRVYAVNKLACGIYINPNKQINPNNKDNG